MSVCETDRQTDRQCVCMCVCLSAAVSVSVGFEERAQYKMCERVA